MRLGHLLRERRRQFRLRHDDGVRKCGRAFRAAQKYAKPLVKQGMQRGRIACVRRAQKRGATARMIQALRDAPEQIGRGHPFDERGEMNSPSMPLNHVALHAFAAMFRRIDVNMRLNDFQQAKRREFVEDRDVIGAFERGEHADAVRFRADRARVAFVALDAAVAVDAHNQGVAERFRLAQHRDMPDMQQIKAAVRRNNDFILRFQRMNPFGELGASKQFFVHDSVYSFPVAR